MATTYECRDCNLIDVDPGVLCGPTAVQIRCDFGRSRAERKDAMCAAMRPIVSHACAICGRPAMQVDLVCQRAAFGV